MTLEERYKGVIAWFQANRPMAESELQYTTPYELMVAVILSAQCTDKRVNMTTPAIFEQYPDVFALSRAAVEDIYRLIKSISYPNSKANYLSAMSQKVVAEFGGVIPNNAEDLQKLPGVGRKTANVLLAVAFDTPAMPVDTHVFRVANRIGLVTRATTPLEVEKQLTQHIAPELLSIAHHWLILHGRYVCVARKPKCTECGIVQYCKEYKEYKQPIG
ncbi:endonuclease III [Bacteroidia bacterium]|nr:endonuclease III [Bacteroidia bacterium]